MPVDNTILNLIRAGNYSGAKDALEAGWPDSVLDLLNATAVAGANAGIIGSLSSVVIGTGTKNFSLASASGWVAGTPVYIVAVSDPLNTFLVGKLASDASGTSITVTVASSSGSGTYANWNVIALFSTTTTVAGPLAVAGGGSGSTTAAGARTSFEVPRQKLVKASQNTPPGSPTTGDVYLVASAPTGAWAGHAGVWATWGGSSWSFATPADGDLSIEVNAGTGRAFRSFGGVQRAVGAEEFGGKPTMIAITGNYTVTAADLADGCYLFLYITSLAGSATLTLPASAGVVGAGIIITGIPGLAFGVSFAATGGETVGFGGETCGGASTIRLLAFKAPAGTAQWLRW